MIKKYVFRGSTTQEALAQAKAQLGDDFAIETTKQIRAKSLNQTPIFEIIACIEVPEDDKVEKIDNIKKQIQAYTNLGRLSKNRFASDNFSTLKQDENNNTQNFATSTDKFQNSYNNTTNNNFKISDTSDKFNNQWQNLQNSAKSWQKSNSAQQQNDIDDGINFSISQVANDIKELAYSDKNTDYEAKMSEIEKKVDKLSDKISLLADAVWEDKANQRADINIPYEFSTIYKKASQSGMKKEHLKAIMEATIANMPSSMKNNPNAIERYFYFLLEKMLPSKKENISNKKQKIIMLIGPTGVGKTTTLSKLVYKYAYENKNKYKTGIITLDSYRIGAVEQLSQYAQVMKIRMIEAINVEEFKAALKSFSGYDVILVDTVGSSPYDTQKLAKLNEFIASTDFLMEINLVLSASTKFEDLLDIYEKFSFANINSLIITKLDETKIFGNIFSLIYETAIPVSYFSAGQNVPEDIMEASSAFLVKCVLEGLDNESSK